MTPTVNRRPSIDACSGRCDATSRGDEASISGEKGTGFGDGVIVTAFAVMM